VVHICNEALLSNKEGKYAIYNKMDGTRDHVKQDKPRSERQIL
jgi:hypothetical protein